MSASHKKVVREACTTLQAALDAVIPSATSQSNNARPSKLLLKAATAALKGEVSKLALLNAQDANIAPTDLASLLDKAQQPVLSICFMAQVKYLHRLCLLPPCM